MSAFYLHRQRPPTGVVLAALVSEELNVQATSKINHHCNTSGSLWLIWPKNYALLPYLHPWSSVQQANIYIANYIREIRRF